MWHNMTASATLVFVSDLISSSYLKTYNKRKDKCFQHFISFRMPAQAVLVAVMLQEQKTPM